jgi:hypothetical protein
MKEVNATPHAELISDLMNPTNQRNEREHAAVREIERLQEMLALAQQESLGPEPFGYFQYDIRLDAWVQNRTNNKGVAFYIKENTRMFGQD